MEQLGEDLDRLPLLLYVCQTMLKHFTKGNWMDLICRHPNIAMNANFGVWGSFKRHLEKLCHEFNIVFFMLKKKPNKKNPKFFLTQQVNTHFKQRVLFPLFLEHNAAVVKYKTAKAI